MTSPLTRLERPQNLREAVLEQLRTAIVTGDLVEGTVTSAPSLAKTFGISPTPVREAMSNLEREGLVETIKNKGFRVTSMTEKELDNLAEIRILIEAPMMHRVVGEIPTSGFNRLQRFADRCLEAADTQDLHAYLIHDRDFHASLLSYAGNDELVELATTLRRRARVYGLKALAESGQLPDSAREHHQMLEFLRAGDGAAAEALLLKHIGHTRDIWATGEQ